MPFCSQCGTENPDVAKFCFACGSALVTAAPPPPPQEVRKVVSIVFSDLKGSTAMGEKLDSESLREVMSRYFDAMSAELERHGGVVEKFIGDAIMAVFGLPTLHEDDALRAVRAAADMQRAQAVLNDELERHWGVRLTVRTGVNTGEVVAGDPTTGQRLVTGDAVNVAARLEQAAGAQEVLLGDLTYRLVRDYVEVEEVEPLELKGKSERVPAYRLVGVHEVAERPRRLDSPLIGRDTELALLQAAFGEAVESRTGRLVTVVGEAGVGKTRLIDEFVGSAGDRALFIRGRCLPYGNGITFWPLAEAAREAAGISEQDSADLAHAKLAAIAPEDVVARMKSAIGLSETPFPVEEIAWGARKFLESLASTQPMLVLFDDIHWAETTFLDLIESIVQSVEDAPVTIVCTARHELVERFPHWSEQERSTRIELERLSEDETAAVVGHILGSVGLDTAVRSRIVQAAEGNPLFVEQLLSMFIDEGHIQFVEGCWHASADLDDVAVPPTIQALLASRLDALEPGERSIIEPASVAGNVFVLDAVRFLVPEDLRPAVTDKVGSLTEKQLVRPDLARPLEEEPYRFHHILIRDTAYEGILKRARAGYHERFVQWGDTVNREGATEYEEILGYHLEQAHRYLSELGPLDDRGREIGLDAARRLAAAGTRAYGRGDMPAAANLLRRATQLFPEDDLRRLELAPKLGEALMEIGDFESASVTLGLAVEEANVRGETRIWADALVTWHLMRRSLADDLEGWMNDVVRELGEVIPALERISAHAELAHAWRLLGHVHGSVLLWREQLEALGKAIENARLAEDIRLEARLAAEYAACLRDGPTPASQAIQECEAALERGLEDRQATAFVYCSLARLQAMQGQFDDARDLLDRAERMRDDLGKDVLVPLTSLQASRVETLAGDLASAERALTRDYEKLSRIGDKYVLPLVGALLARAVLQQGRYEDAAQLYTAASDLADEKDVETQVILRCVAARLGSEGRGGAEELVREAIALLDGVESPDLLGDAFVTLGDVLATEGRSDEAGEALRRALDLYAAKGNLVSAERTRVQLGGVTSVAGQTVA